MFFTEFMDSYETQASEHVGLDTARFEAEHHYGLNFNFVVKSDSFILIRQQPEEVVNGLLITDSFAVRQGERLVVADIRIMPNDHVDTVWVQLAQEEANFGWVRESTLLDNVDPDDPISQFISIFSNDHLLWFLIAFSFIIMGYVFFIIFRRKTYIVHFNDIDTFYPTLLTLIVSAAATFYSSIQMFAPEAWRDFYFHPTLNPFSLPPLLAVFLALVWAMLIVSLAAADDTLHQLPVGDAALYLSGLAAVCAACYVIFTFTTLYYVGYVLLVAYILFAVWRFCRFARSPYVCGNCGARLRGKGRCEQCGADNY